MTNEPKRDRGGAASEPDDIAAAAIGLETELRRFESLTMLLDKLPLNSPKNLDRAIEASREAAESHARFAEHLRALGEAVGVARDRQRISADTINARVAELEQRRAELTQLEERFGRLGDVARQINTLVQQVNAHKHSGEAPDTSELAAQLGTVMEQMGTVVDEARAIANDARDGNWPDLARQADALRQQIQSAQNRLRLLEQSLSGRPPPN